MAPGAPTKETRMTAPVNQKHLAKAGGLFFVAGAAFIAAGALAGMLPFYGVGVAFFGVGIAMIAKSRKP